MSRWGSERRERPTSHHGDTECAELHGERQKQETAENGGGDGCAPKQGAATEEPVAAPVSTVSGCKRQAVARFRRL